MHILLVDDEKLNRVVIGRMIEIGGYTYYGCGSGQEAIDYLMHHDCDLVLMDRQMPDMDGLETTRRIRALPAIKQPKIVSFSAYTDEKSYREAIESGMDAVIDKPVTLDDLNRTITDLQDS